jgi:hypothetical protein
MRQGLDLLDREQAQVVEGMLECNSLLEDLGRSRMPLVLGEMYSSHCPDGELKRGLLADSSHLGQRGFLLASLRREPLILSQHRRRSSQWIVQALRNNKLAVE